MATSANAVNDPSPAAKDAKPQLGLWIALVVVIFFVVLSVISRSGVIICRVRHVDLVMQSLHTALGRYRAHCGVFPKGDNKAIIRALRGENPVTEEFIRLGPEFLSPNGELLDPWGTPYRFDFTNDDVVVRSAGPNKYFDVSGGKGFDDITR